MVLFLRNWNEKTDAMRKFLQWSHLLFFYIWNISWVQRSPAHRCSFLIAELHRARGTLELSPIAKKIWLSIHLRKFGSHMTLCPSTRTGSQCSLSSVDLEFRLRQETLKDIFFRMCLSLGHVFCLLRSPVVWKVTCERQTFLLAHRRWGTFREEERLRLSDRNSILMT